MKIIKKARHHSRIEQAKFILFSIVTLLVSLVEIISLGYLTSEARIYLLLSDFFDD